MAAGVTPVSGVQGDFAEASAQPKVRSVPLSHVSIELGHLYMEDLKGGPARLEALFAEAKPWVAAAVAAVRTGRSRPRVSTCFLIDDYFSTILGPDVVLPQVMAAAQATGLTIDYLARESSCAQVESGGVVVSPAELLVDRLVSEPVEGTTGARPPAAQAGWLCNGERSPHDVPGDALDALDAPAQWRPPIQAAARRHSIFVDVQLWDFEKERRVWSCPLMAAVWQLMRLGLIRDHGHPPTEPMPFADAWPDSWSQLPPVTQLNAKAAPFTAYSTMSVLSPRFLPVEMAVRTILGQVWHDPAVLALIAERAAAEEVALPPEVLDRISYAFAGTGTVDPA